MTTRLYVGGIVTPLSKEQTRIIESGIIGVDDNGLICLFEDLDSVEDIPASVQADVLPSLSPPLDTLTARKVMSVVQDAAIPIDTVRIELLPNNTFLSPGFVDTHTHACQVVRAR